MLIVRVLVFWLINKYCGVVVKKTFVFELFIYRTEIPSAVENLKEPPVSEFIDENLKEPSASEFSISANKAFFCTWVREN